MVRRGQVAADRDSGAPVIQATCSSGLQSAREEAGWSPSQGSRPSTLEERNPREDPAPARAKHLLKREGLSEGSKPRNRDSSGRPGASAAGIPLRETVCGCILGGNAGDTFREEKPPKGKSHERCRYETRSAGTRREQAVKRVTKPWRRNVAGWHARVKWTSESLCAEGTESPWEDLARLRPAG